MCRTYHDVTDNRGGHHPSIGIGDLLSRDKHAESRAKTTRRTRLQEASRRASDARVHIQHDVRPQVRKAVAPGKIDPLQRGEPERLVFQRGVPAHSIPPTDVPAGSAADAVPTKAGAVWEIYGVQERRKNAVWRVVEPPKLWDEGNPVLRRSASTRRREGSASATLVATYENRSHR
jgi:hypothetical protein